MRMFVKHVKGMMTIVHLVMRDFDYILVNVSKYVNWGIILIMEIVRNVVIIALHVILDLIIAHLVNKKTKLLIQKEDALKCAMLVIHALKLMGLVKNVMINAILALGI